MTVDEYIVEIATRLRYPAVVNEFDFISWCEQRYYDLPPREKFSEKHYRDSAEAYEGLVRSQFKQTPEGRSDRRRVLHHRSR